MHAFVSSDVGVAASVRFVCVVRVKVIIRPRFNKKTSYISSGRRDISEGIYLLSNQPFGGAGVARFQFLKPFMNFPAYCKH